MNFCDSGAVGRRVFRIFIFRRICSHYSVSDLPLLCVPQSHNTLSKSMRTHTLFLPSSNMAFVLCLLKFLTNTLERIKQGLFRHRDALSCALPCLLC